MAAPRWSASSTRCWSLSGLYLRHLPRRFRGRAAPVQQLDRGPPDDGLCRGLPQHSPAALDPRDLRGDDGIDPAAPRFPRRGCERVDDPVRQRCRHQPRHLHSPGPCGGRIRAFSSPSSWRLSWRSGPSAATPGAAGADRRHPPGLLDFARPLLRAVDPVLLHPRSPGDARLSRAWGFNFSGGIQLAELADRALASRCRSIPAPSSPRSSALVSSPSPRARPRPPSRSACAPTGR
jgi:hypothetical protein